uniref:Ig-like domain-containing protein n=1 Tax=Electrophorus electricus TaxID=8005 RepID=A0A4W4EIC2_ELEEL
MFCSLSHGKPEQKRILFSQGVKLVVNANGVRSGTPNVQILLPVAGQMETSKAAILTCIVQGLHTKVKDITWKMNDATALRRHTSCEVFQESDGTFTALAFYFVPVHKGTSDSGIFRCEVSEKGITYYEEVQLSHCDLPVTL